MDLSDLLHICKAYRKLGDAVAEQIEDAACGDFSECNPNALEMIDRELLQKVARHTNSQEDEQLREESAYLSRTIKDYLSELEAPVEEEPRFANCGCCGHLHRESYTGDCRDDSARFTHESLDIKYGTDGWTELGERE